MLHGQVELLGEAGLSFHQGADSGAVIRARRSVERAVLPSRVEISAQISTAWPARGLSQSSVTPAGHVSDPTRSSSGRNRGELGRTGRRSSGGTSLAVPSFGRNVVPFFQICAADRLTPTSMAATRNGTPWAINSTNRCRANDFGRLPRTSGIRRVDNEYLSTRVYVASFAGNQPTAT